MPRKNQRESLVDRRFGRLVIVAFSHTDGRRDSVWSCRCDCGATVLAARNKLQQEQTRSCGCLRRETTRVRYEKHGHNRLKSRTPEYNSWVGMKNRVKAKTGRNWLSYGARGISMCERWQTFANFLADMGPKPSPKHSLDRINNDGNYEPGNCRWATASEQVRNRRTLK